MKLRVILLPLVMLAASSFAMAASDTPWRHMAEQDLAAVHDTIGVRHPGPVDARNPTFTDWHERGYREALALAAQAEDFDGYEAAMRYYVNGFHDGHLALGLEIQASRGMWPGFVVAWRNGEMRVHHVADAQALPQVGDALVACDGIAADALYAQRVLPYYGNPEIASSRVLFMPRTFVDPVGTKVHLKSCTFRGAAGEGTLDLAWKRISIERLAPLLRRAGFGEAPPLGVHRVAGNGTWLSLPSFNVEGSAIDALKATLAELPQHRDSAYVVIDVRGNGGGSSHWGGQATEALYGKDFARWMDDAMAYRTRNTYVEFRVSKATADHFRNELPRLAQGAGIDSPDYRYLERIVLNLDAAVARGDTLLDDRAVQRELLGTPARPGPKPEPLFRGRVYFLTDAQCGSACLDFADLLLRAPNVVHVGQPTSADTVYMDIDSRRLPSNTGLFGFPTKVHRGRERGHNAAYVPAFEWKDDMWKQEELERWIEGLERRQTTTRAAKHR